MNSKSIKHQALKNGVQLCGIAPINRFDDAPVGFSPLDLFPQTQSVISFGKQIPKSLLNLSTYIPYTVADSVVLADTHRVALELSLYIESHGYSAVMVPSEPYEYWDTETMTGKGIVSLKHLAHKSGLGVFGRNQLLYNPQIGNLMKLGAVLTDAILEPDDVIETEICSPTCNLCEKNCPSNAISSVGVEQKKCRLNTEKSNAKGIDIYSCNTCRKICPNVTGFKYDKASSTYLNTLVM